VTNNRATNLRLVASQSNPAVRLRVVACGTFNRLSLISAPSLLAVVVVFRRLQSTCARYFCAALRMTG
jgi:hypothetical protein